MYLLTSLVVHADFADGYVSNVEDGLSVAASAVATASPNLSSPVLSAAAAGADVDTTDNGVPDIVQPQEYDAPTVLNRFVYD